MSITQEFQVANIIFVDAPVGTGFSYAKTWRGYANMSDTLSAAQTYEFLRKVRIYLATNMVNVFIYLSEHIQGF